AGAGQGRPVALLAGAVRAIGRGRHPELAARCALAGGQPMLLSRFPERFGIGVRRDVDLLAGQDTRGAVSDGGGHYALLKIMPEIGSGAGPPVTSASSQSATWLMAVPRSCSM